jgi:hypothetical protein
MSVSKDIPEIGSIPSGAVMGLQKLDEDVVTYGDSVEWVDPGVIAGEGYPILEMLPPILALLLSAGTADTSLDLMGEHVSVFTVGKEGGEAEYQE